MPVIRVFLRFLRRKKITALSYHQQLEHISVLSKTVSADIHFWQLSRKMINFSLLLEDIHMDIINHNHRRKNRGIKEHNNRLDYVYLKQVIVVE